VLSWSISLRCTWKQLRYADSQGNGPFTVPSGLQSEDELMLTVLSIYTHLLNFFYVHWFSFSAHKWNPGNGNVHDKRECLHAQGLTIGICRVLAVVCKPTRLLPPTVLVKINETGNKQLGKSEVITAGVLLRNRRSRNERRVCSGHWANMWKNSVKFYTRFSTVVKLASRLFT
jgi:hypothetical protein